MNAIKASSVYVSSRVAFDAIWSASVCESENPLVRQDGRLRWVPFMMHYIVGESGKRDIVSLELRCGEHQRDAHRSALARILFSPSANEGSVCDIAGFKVWGEQDSVAFWNILLYYSEVGGSGVEAINLSWQFR